MYSFRCFNACTREIDAQPWLEEEEEDDKIPNLLLQQIFFLIPLNGRHDRGPDHAHSLRLGETVLLHILAQLGDDLLGALTLRDAVPQAALKLLIIEVEMMRERC